MLVTATNPESANSDSSTGFGGSPLRMRATYEDRPDRKDASDAADEARRRHKRAVIFRMVGDVIGLMVVAAVLWTFKLRSRKPAIPPDGTWLPQPVVKVPKSLRDFKVGVFSVNWQRDSAVAVVSGDIENVSENLHRDITVTLELLDAQGTKVGTVDGFTTELQEHGIWRVVARTSNTNAFSARFSSIKEGL